MPPSRRFVPGFVLAILLGAGAASAKSKTAVEIGPGPREMSEGERSIVLDPEKGIEHGVILKDEFEKNENLGTDNKYSFHMRAKILSPEACSFGDIEIPYNIVDGYLLEWWGRTILPDGRVLELKESDLKEQKISRRSGEREVRHLKGVIPGVVPGCIVDYGYIFKISGGIDLEHRIPLRRSWPIRELTCRWIPYEGRSSAYRVAHSENLEVKVTSDGKSLLFTGKDFPALKSEPFMPPLTEVQPALILYYLDRSKDLKRFWFDEAKAIDARAVAYSKGDQKRIRDALAEMNIPADVDIRTRIRAIYDWTVSKLRNRSLRSWEEIETNNKAEIGKSKKEKKNEEIDGVGDILDRREGYGLGINYLFLAFMREVGAQAYMTLVPDRTNHFWDPKRFDTDQFEARFVAVGGAEESIEKLMLLNPGGGDSFGEVPWWFTGVRAFVATPEGDKTLMVPPSPAARNLASASVTIHFKEDGTSLEVTWSRRASGQNWYMDRRNMQGMKPQDRQKRLDEICGSSSRFEVSRAEGKAGGEYRSPFEIACTGEMQEPNVPEGSDPYELPISGAWIEEIPEFPASTRTYPVVFNFPRTDRTTIEVDAPPGFQPRGAPPPVNRAGEFGAYSLSVQVTPTGYHVERSFTLVPLKVEAAGYTALRAFLADARQADQSKLVFERSGGEPQ